MSETHTTIEQSARLCDKITTILDDGKGQDISRMEISELTPMTDFMGTATITATR